MAQCKERTQSGSQCRNQAIRGTSYCYLHSKKKKRKKKEPSRNHVLFCSFCDKSQYEVNKLVAGPEALICNECVNLCIDICTNGGDDYASLPQLQEYINQNTNKEQNIETLGIKPKFRKLKFEKRSNHCFLLCPFSEPFNTIYSDHLKPVIEEVGFTVERADDIYGTQPIIEDIWEQINSAEIVLADVTGKNPNVMYEIGMAHTVGRPVIIVTQDINDVPFDLKQYRCIIYEYTPRGMKELQRQVEGTLRFLRQSDDP